MAQSMSHHGTDSAQALSLNKVESNVNIDDIDYNPDAGIHSDRECRTEVHNSPATPSLAANGNQSALNIVAEGGVKAWTTILGAWLVIFATVGYIFVFFRRISRQASVQALWKLQQELMRKVPDYYTRVLLSTHSPGKIAWIGSLQLMMPFFFGAVSGKLFDAGYFYVLEIWGGVIFSVSLFLSSLSQPQKYYQAFLSQGVGMGLGLGLTFVPTASIAVHHFKRTRALATGIVLSGGAFGSAMFPIMINHRIQSVGFGAAVRESGYVVLGCLVLGNCLMRTAYPTKDATEKVMQPNIRGFFSDPPYLFGILGSMLTNFGIFFPMVYLQLYAVQHRIDPNLAFYAIPLMNGMGAFGRVGANFLADMYGPFNIYVPCTIINAALIFAFFSVKTKAALIAFSIIFGIFSGAWLSLSVSAAASLARRPDEVGARIGIVLAVSSFGALGAAPSQGSLLGDAFLWDKAIIFSGSTLGASAFFFIVIRILLVRERRTQKV